MKEAGFMGVAALVSFIGVNFLSIPSGIGGMVKLIGTVAAISGGGVGIVVSKSTTRWVLVVGSILVALGLFVLALMQFKDTTTGNPGPDAARVLYVWTAVMFGCVGYIIEMAGLKVTE